MEKGNFYKQNRDAFLTAILSVVYLTWFFLLERHVTNNYHIIHVALDDYIPFCEYFIVPYLLWFGYVFVFCAYFYKRERVIFRKLIAFLFIGMFSALLFCTIYPNGTDFRPAVDPDKNVFSALVYALYGVDTPTNVLPSIHVYNSLAIQIAVMQSETLRKYQYLRGISLVLCVLICMATVFLKQHSVVDVFAAGVMAYAVYGAVYGAGYAAETDTQTARAENERLL